MDSSSSNRMARHGRVVKMCTGSGVEIHLGSSTDLNNAQRAHSPHQLQRQRYRLTDGAFQRQSPDAVQQQTRDGMQYVQPTAPGLDTLQRPSPSSLQTATDEGHAEVTRPPAFNPTSATAANPARGHKVEEENNSSADSAAEGASYRTLPPPSYEEIYGQQIVHDPQQEKDDDDDDAPLMPTTSATPTPTESWQHANTTSLRCVAQIGNSHLNDHATSTPDQLIQPTRISVRDDDQPGNPAVLVVGRRQSSVHVFTSSGEFLTQLTVPGVNGGCFIGPQPLLLLAVGPVVAVYDLDGSRVKEIPLVGRQHGAAVLTTVGWGECGFVAVRKHSLSICKAGIARPAVVHTLAARKGRGPMTSFVNIRDVAVDRRQSHLVVLDAADPTTSKTHRTAVYVLTEAGQVLRSIRPARDPRCPPLTHPYVALVNGRYVLLSDGGRLLQFSVDDGSYVNTLIDGQRSSDDSFRVRGIAVRSAANQQFIYAVLTGQNSAQVAVLALP